MTRTDIIQKVANVIVFIFFASMTGYTTFGKDRIANLLEEYETYFSPARWLFLAWSSIHIFLFCFVIYQWTDAAHDIVTRDVNWMFVISAVLNSIWFRLLEDGHTILSFIISLILVSSVSIIFHNLAQQGASSWAEKLFIHAPFSLWHGFTIFLVVLDAFIAFTKVDKDEYHTVLPPAPLQVALVYLALIFLTISAIGYVQYKHDRGDVTSSWVIAFSLWAVFDQQRPFDVICWPTLVAAILSTIYPAKPYIYKLFRISTSSSEASTPLLG
ncbi:hypothetical protein BDC45DRAFT_475587 [Circinella umbellata]|nr:hypothetical protein BDC45DRAFT_475587 [Circinella umbellata]